MNSDDAVLELIAEFLGDDQEDDDRCDGALLDDDWDGENLFAD